MEEDMEDEDERDVTPLIDEEDALRWMTPIFPGSVSRRVK